MKRILIKALLSFIFVTTVSCKKNEDFFKKNPPTQSGENVFLCSRMPSGDYTQIFKGNVKDSNNHLKFRIFNSNGRRYYQIAGYDSSDKDDYVSIHLQEDKIVWNEKYKFDNAGDYAVYSVDALTLTKYSTDNKGGKGYVVFKRYDADVIAGQFDFTTGTESGKSWFELQGYFDFSLK